MIMGATVPRSRIEKVLRDFGGTEGMTVNEVTAELAKSHRKVTAVAVKKIFEDSLNVIALPRNHYAHIDCFTVINEDHEAGIVEVERTLDRILQRHFVQFGGYSNKFLLFNAASRELRTFVNENGCDAETIYALAIYFFTKKVNRYVIHKDLNPHIFKSKPDYPMTLEGLLIDIARQNGGLLDGHEAKDYFKRWQLAILKFMSIWSILIKSSNEYIKRNETTPFLFYDYDYKLSLDRYILVEALGNIDVLCQEVHDKLDNLFTQYNVDYVILRDFTDRWFAMLPSLPHALPWTPFFLQKFLEQYHKQVGFRVIPLPVLGNKRYDRLDVAVVRSDSGIRSFADVVALYLHDNFELPREMLAEELRCELRHAGILSSTTNYLFGRLPEVLPGLPFEWSSNGRTVKILPLS